MLILGYLLLFLCVVVVYIHVVNYYKTNNEIDYIELFEPLKTDYEKICKNKFPFTVLFENSEHLKEGKSALAPPLLYKKKSNKIFINNNNESIVFCENSERNVIFIENDNISVKLFPPKSKEYLNKLKTSVWDTNILDNVRHIKVNLRKNSILIVPPFWHYSFKITEQSILNDNQNEKNDDKQNKKNNKSKTDEKIVLEQNFYITYPNLLGVYLEKCKSYIDDFLK